MDIVAPGLILRGSGDGSFGEPEAFAFWGPFAVETSHLAGDDDVWQSGDWQQVADPTGVGGFRASTVDHGAAKVTAPAASPASSVVIKFTPDPTQTYKLWIRLKAERNSYYNDSVWVQFSGATDAAGLPAYRIGTTSGLPVNLEECANRGLAAGDGRTTAGAPSTVTASPRDSPTADGRPS
jgi:hypothetical protein